MKTIEELITELASKNEEISIYFLNPSWRIGFGNPLTCVLIGEGPAKLDSESDSLRQALEEMIILVNR